MKVTDIFLANVRRLMGGMNPNQAAGKWKFPQRTLASYVGGEAPERAKIQISSLEKLAEGADLEPWQLLVPNMDPEKLPVLLPSEGDEAELLRLFSEMDGDSRPALLARAKSLCKIDKEEARTRDRDAHGKADAA